jgi:PLP dependent protein
MISENVKRIYGEIAEAAIAAGREPGEITLIAVTKTRTVEEIREAVDAGVAHLGENRVQEALEKIPLLEKGPVWHLVGSLQSNKAKTAAGLFDWIESIHSRKIADILSLQAQNRGKTLDVLIQVNISGEDTKSGIEPDEAKDLALYMEHLPGLTLRGLMTIGSFGAEPRVTRNEFGRMKTLFDSLSGDPRVKSPFDTLSMGMSGDYRIAVEEGATLVRVGQAIFGERDYRIFL